MPTSAGCCRGQDGNKTQARAHLGRSADAHIREWILSERHDSLIA